jgi:hypothetical protein
MHQLNLPNYDFKIKKGEQSSQIFDIIRRKYVVLTPEEWVRQHFVKYLIEVKQYPASLIALEMSLKYNTMQRRSDIVVFNNEVKPILIVECKAASVKVSPAVFEQIARYNMALNVKYLIVTNGINHYCCSIEYENRTFTFLNDIPKYSEL